MKKKKDIKKQPKKNIIEKEKNFTYFNLEDEKLIEIQAEAYYRAIKRLEQEKLKTIENKDEDKKEKKWFMKILLLINIFLFPWKINKHFKINKQIYDSILVIVVSFVMKLTGSLIWFGGVGLIIYAIVCIKQDSFFQGIFTYGVVSLFAIELGDMLIISANEFSKETDSNKIYAYSASIIALMSCVIGLIALVRV